MSELIDIVRRLEAHPKLREAAACWDESFDPHDNARDSGKAYNAYVTLLLADAVLAGVLWITREGEMIFVEELTDRHLANIISYLERRLADQVEATDAAFGFAAGCRGDMATYYAGHETEGALQRELRTRKLLEHMRAEDARRKKRVP